MGAVRRVALVVDPNIMVADGLRERELVCDSELFSTATAAELVPSETVVSVAAHAAVDKNSKTKLRI